MIDARAGTLVATLWIVSVAIGLSAAQAHKGATGIVKQRMDGMKRMGEIAKAWGAMRKGKTSFDPAAVRAQAGLLKQHAADMPKLFPKGSIEGPSEALPAIWQKWDDFEGIARQLATLAEQLEGDAGQRQGTAFPLMVRAGATCSSCHKGYRKENK